MSLDSFMGSRPGRGKENAVAILQVIEEIDIAGEKQGQAQEKAEAFFPHQAQEEFGSHKGDKQPEEKLEGPAHGTILPNCPPSGKAVGVRHLFCCRRLANPH